MGRGRGSGGGSDHGAVDCLTVTAHLVRHVGQVDAQGGAGLCESCGAAELTQAEQNILQDGEVWEERKVLKHQANSTPIGGRRKAGRGDG